MFDIKAELMLGELSGAPLYMRPTLKGINGIQGFLEMALTQKATKDPRANFLYVGLFERDGKFVKELDYSTYRRISVIRTVEGWKPFRAKESSMVIINTQRIVFPKFIKPTLVNYVGVMDWNGSLLTLGKLRNPFMGVGHVFFDKGSLVIRMV